ncbi:MAG: patatin-like phospholipase family protein [Ilumatobacter sp.]|nr:patatin-like phospholipase family protein [Ilumatobacter sp.]
MTTGRAALVLTGGGARAAYQVGVLGALRELWGAREGNPFPILCGTSAGAINAVALATHAHDFSVAVRRVAWIWRHFHVDQVYRADAAALAATADAGSGTRREPDPDELPGLFSYLVEVPKPVIAAVNGVAAGGGFVLVAKCDLRFASTAASFTTVFSKRGLIAEHGLSWLTPRQVGMGDALDLLWSSRKIDAVEAHRIGLVQRVVEPDALVADAVAYVDDLAANVSPNSLAVTKRLAYAHLGAGMRAAFTEADVATYEALDHPDVKEGVQSFVERRPPRFRRLGGPTTM